MIRVLVPTVFVLSAFVAVVGWMLYAAGVEFADGVDPYL